MARKPQTEQPDPIAAVSAKVDQLADSVATLSQVVSNIVQRAPIVAPSKVLDTREIPGPADAVVTMPVDGTPRLEGGAVEKVDGPKPKAFLDELAFNEELVTVRLADDHSEYPEPYVPVWNDGRIQVFPRGQDITCKRKFVEVLARAKPWKYANKETTDESGMRRIDYPRRVSHAYPFQVIRDDNPRGADWLRKLMAEA